MSELALNSSSVDSFQQSALSKCLYLVQREKKGEGGGEIDRKIKGV